MRRIVAVLIALATPILAFPFLFGDPAPGESVVLRIVVIVVIFGLGGGSVGWLARRRWQLAALCAWAPVALGLVMLLGKLSTGNTPPYWSAIVGFLLGPLLVSLLSSYAALQLRERQARRSDASNQPQAP